MQNGLLAASAFCNADGGGENRAHLKTALDETARHLAERGLIARDVAKAKSMIDDLCGRSSHELQQATTEALAFLAYLKRFAPKD
jgi:CRISPR/Cas system CMR-associated protein Cmr5 small subunit